VTKEVSNLKFEKGCTPNFAKAKKMAEKPRQLIVLAVYIA
jgi:hypothetical protein